MPSNPADYQKAYRAANPDYQQKQKQLENARRAARIRLAKMYPTDYEALLAEEAAKYNLYRSAEDGKFR